MAFSSRAFSVLAFLAAGSAFGRGEAWLPKPPDPPPAETLTNEARYLEWKWRTDVTDAGTGVDNAALKAGAAKIAAELKAREPWAVVKARMFEYVCDHTAIGCSGLDWFPAFASWNRYDWPLWRPIRIERNREVDERYLKKEAAAVSRGWQEGRFSMWKDFSHSVPDWDDLFARGWPGLDARLKAHEKDTPFYRAERITLDAAVRLLKRLAAHAKAQAAEAHGRDDPAPRVRRLEAQAAALKAIAERPPRTTYEALTFIYTWWVICEHLDAMQVRSLGTLDRLLTPFYRADLAAGRLDEAGFRELLRHFWWQWGSIDNYWGQPVALGGTKRDGTTEFNEVSKIILEVHDELNLPTPKMIVKVAASTPPEMLARILSVARGNRPVVLVGEESIAKALKGWRHCTDEECRTVEMNGCYEFYTRGTQNITQSSHISFIQPVSDVLAQAARGEVQAKTFADFKALYLAELLRNVRECLELTDAWERYLNDINPSNVYSLSVPSSIESGKDAFYNGLVYNDTALLSVSLGTAVDALLAVKEIVYERKEMSLAELGRLMSDDWKGREDLRLRMMRSKRKWGNNDAEANAIGAELVRFCSARFNGRPNVRGGRFHLSGHSARMHIELGKSTGATPDGRRAGEEMSKNISPTMGVDTEGVTALLNTVKSLDARDLPGDFPLDVALLPHTVAGEKGLQAMRTLIETYFDNGGMVIQFNIQDAETLRDAQTHPERYENLQVRVCGWNVRWNDIPKVEQDKFILRQEMISQ